MHNVLYVPFLKQEHLEYVMVQNYLKKGNTELKETNF